MPDGSKVLSNWLCIKPQTTEKLLSHFRSLMFKRYWGRSPEGIAHGSVLTGAERRIGARWAFMYELRGHTWYHSRRVVVGSRLSSSEISLLATGAQSCWIAGMLDSTPVVLRFLGTAIGVCHQADRSPIWLTYAWDLLNRRHRLYGEGPGHLFSGWAPNVLGNRWEFLLDTTYRGDWKSFNFNLVEKNNVMFGEIGC